MNSRRKRIRFRLLVGVGVVLVVITACAIKQSAGSGPSPVTTMTTLNGWSPSIDNPIIPAGDMYDRAMWNDPCVLKTDNGYVMYLTTSIKEPFKPPVLPFRAESTDGEHWKLNPSTPLLDPTGTPYVGLETPSVIQFNGQYHMYYSGIVPPGTVPFMAIGHATSPDGITWTHDPKYTVLKATGTVTDWNGFLVGEPGAVVYEGQVCLYFSAVGARPGGSPPQLQVIGLATSRDGFTFDNPHPVLQQSALYPPEKGFVGYSCPMAVERNGAIHLFHNVAWYDAASNPQWQQVALQHAMSADGESNWAQDPAPIFTRDSLDWTHGGIIGPTALFDGDTLKLWFGGHSEPKEFAKLAMRGWKGREFGIGYATTTAARYDAK